MNFQYFFFNILSSGIYLKQKHQKNNNIYTSNGMFYFFLRLDCFGDKEALPILYGNSLRNPEIC